MYTVPGCSIDPCRSRFSQLTRSHNEHCAMRHTPRCASVETRPELRGRLGHQVLSLHKDSWTKIGHLNVHSYLAKHEDIVRDQAIGQTEMCFTETFLRPQQELEADQPVSCCIHDRCCRILAGLKDEVYQKAGTVCQGYYKDIAK